ncbi:SDR family NAD(P)-dependent oxidoreductase [Alteromonas oceanisediminis]|uniref:SDR family NAD(P)-dependent oxidoreductase n=1 Tax=Alteromonas oceanisediminis TaxID=2836180 RepID=UPI001BDA49E1|nr:SDR family oxidoreductase [Alteromonas oceanisediminis]MBT0587377.1 SDR family oxidoreductase [Alteromonas oceanisediminis]
MPQTITIITGASMGIGLAIAQQQVREGAFVFNLDQQDFCQPLENASWLPCDVSNVNQVRRLINQCAATTGRIDRLVCNAGIHLSATIEETGEAMLDKVFAVNVKGAYAAIQAVLPIMREQERGAIVLMGSDQSVVGKRSAFAYGMSKAALASMAKTTALDYAAFNIRVNAVCPGTIETPLFHAAIDRYVAKTGKDKKQVVRDEAAEQPLNTLGQPDDVAALTGFLLSEQARFITGSLHAVDGGYTAG